MSRGRVCMYVPYLYPVLSGGRVPFAGGIEVQLALLGRGLARRGFEATIVTCDYGQPPELVVEGVRLLRCWRPESGPPVLRFFHPRLTRTTAALLRADADVYLYRGGAMGAGLVHDVARARGRAFLLMVGHDHDVQRDLPDVRGWRDRSWVRRALRGADLIVCQTERQQAELRRAFGREGVVIPNSVDVPDAAAAPGANRTVVWLATYKDAKRPEWFTRFAERHPEQACVMVGVVLPGREGAAFEAARAVARRCANLDVRGTVPHERVGELLQGAALLAHTSPAEGFPNAFLEAWSHGIPTVTCFDPDGLVAREGLGEVHGDFESWEDAVLRWMADPRRRAEAGQRARAFVERAHAADRIHERFAAELDALLARRRAAPAPARS